MLAKMIGFLGEKPDKKPQRTPKRSIIKDRQVFERKEQTIDAPKVSKKLFWGKYPHYPEMNSSYRTLLQKLKVDNSKTIKVHDAHCGADLCQIASGIGPHVDYCCLGAHAQLIDNNIKKFDLARKTQRISEGENELASPQYFAHLISFEATEGDDKDLNWNALADTTLSGGFVMIPRITIATDGTVKTSQKLADNIEFYFYTKVDHTAHWITVLEDRIENMKKLDPQSAALQNKQVLRLYADEATKWAMTLKELKSGTKKVITMIYKRDDI